MLCSNRQEAGLTILEVLISLAVFSICIVGLSQAERYSIEQGMRAEKKARALLVAQGLYEEMSALPFSGAAGSAQDDAQSRPERMGGFLAYRDFLDSPIHDAVGQTAEWGRGLYSVVSIRTFTPEDRSGAVLPQSVPTGEYAETAIRVRDVGSEETLADLRYIRTK